MASQTIAEYYESTQKPWGRLYYRLIWNHLRYENQRILDFGSGLGLTAGYLAVKNQVVAVEPNREMIAFADYGNVSPDCGRGNCASASPRKYDQRIGSLEVLAEFPDRSFDVIICHNVLEYIENRQELLNEFHRLLRDGGRLSLLKHNHAGKIMHKAVQENDIESALRILDRENDFSPNFGSIREYDEEELASYLSGRFVLQNKFGVRIFFGIQRNECKMQADWEEKMFLLESRAEEIPEFRDIAFSHHLILSKIGG